MKQGNRVLGARRSVILGPTAQLNGERHGELGELEHMLEAELVRDVVSAGRTGSAEVSTTARVGGERSEHTYSFALWMY